MTLTFQAVHDRISKLRADPNLKAFKSSFRLKTTITSTLTFSLNKISKFLVSIVAEFYYFSSSFLHWNEAGTFLPVPAPCKSKRGEKFEKGEGKMPKKKYPFFFVSPILNTKDFN